MSDETISDGIFEEHKEVSVGGHYIDHHDNDDDSTGRRDEASVVLTRQEQVPLTRWKSSPTFYDPFDENGQSKIRRDSSSSSGSEYLRPGAFDNHRDTLARIQRKSDPGRTLDIEYEGSRLQKSLITFRYKALMLHRDTLTILRHKQNFSKNLSPEALLQIATYLSIGDYSNMRLTCRQWADDLPRPHRPANQRLPVEVLLNIFSHLPSSGFDAARHTCKSWYLASLDPTLAMSMIKTSGAHLAHLADVELEYTRALESELDCTHGRCEDELGYDCLTGEINHEWLMSKRLATEARLSPRWSGSAFHPTEGHTPGHFTTVQEIDFGALMSTQNKERSKLSTLNTLSVSACGAFFILSSGANILVYDLRRPRDSLQLVVRIDSGAQVLAVSMDTSSGRTTLVALLKDRIGMA